MTLTSITPTTAQIADPLGAVIGQDQAVAQLRNSVAHPLHAYMFVGPRGSGRRQAAAAFAAELLANSDPDGAERHRKLAVAEQHPDLFILEPEGRALLVDEAAQLITEASRSPVEGTRKVLVVDRFHTAEARVAPKLLKTIEEPPSPVVFILISEEVPLEHITVASRCVRIDFGPVSRDAIEQLLVSEGVDAARSAEVAGASNGSVERARLLANDDHFAARRDAWRSVPSRLDGTGASVAVLVDELRELIDAAQAPLVARHEVERADLDRREEELGTRGSGRKLLEARHKREIRSVRDDELSFGLGTVGGVYRHVLIDHPMPSIIVSALQRLSAAGEALGRNPNEKLLLLALFVELPTLSSS
ncbi:MAG: hypothetical protein V3V01_16280 [Acidimicrobiales bacterium]